MNGEKPRIVSRFTRRRFVALAPLSVAGAALLAACGGQAPAPPAATSAPAPAAAPTTAPAAAPTAAPTPAATAAPAPTTAPAATAVATATTAANVPADIADDQTLKTTGFGNPTTLEPAQEGGSLRIMTQNVWRPAFYLDEKGQFLPGVCTKWEVTDDGLTYTLHVDPAAKWSDGTPITAADIKASYEHSADPALKTWTFPYLMQPVQGAQDVQDGKTKTISGIVAKDDATLQITLAKPYTPFIKNLANYIGGIIKVSDVKGDGWEAKSTASGPFQVASWNRDTGEVSWVQNKNWWGPKPLIQKVTYRYIKDNNTSSIMYDNNEMDVFLPADIISAQLRKGAHASELHLIPYGGEYYYRFRADLKPFDDPKVRLAFLKATDMTTAVQAVFQGGQVPATGIISPNLDCYQNLKAYYDPSGAKEALASSTYKTADALPPITLAVGTNLTEYIQLSQAVQQMWKQNLGVDVTIHQYDPSANDPVRQTAQILRSSLGTIVYDPSASISQMALSENTPFKLGTGGGYKNAQVDDLLHKADTTPLSKNADRCSAYDQAENIVMSEAPYIPIIWVNYYYAVKPWVKNYASNIDLSLYTLASNPPLYIAKH